MRQAKNFDSSDGTNKEIDLNIDESTLSLRIIGIDAMGKKEDLLKLCENNNLPFKKMEVVVYEV